MGRGLLMGGNKPLDLVDGGKGVAYRARTDDNDIIPGDLYELCCWDNGWRTLGRKQATDYTLSWDNVPTGTLYWIYDRTKGVEQRIFTYRDGQITWW